MKIQEKLKYKNGNPKSKRASQQDIFSNHSLGKRNSLYNKSDLEIKNSTSKTSHILIRNNIDSTVIIKNESSYLVLKSFIREHQIKNSSYFILYLSEIWRELSLYTPNFNDGIIPFAFSRFFPLPGLINKRLFNVLDTDQDGYLSPKEFIKGLSIIYCEEICSLIEFIFLFYDFDYDGYITSEDIHAIMSYIPVIHSFSDMIDIEEEIQNTLNNIFLNKKSKINICEFIDLIINKEVYEIFIPIISFFFEQRPFTNQQIDYFGKLCKNNKTEENNKYLYRINNKIKLKVFKNKEENEEDKEYKIIFDFDKSKYKDITMENDITNLEKKESSTINPINITNNKIMDNNDKIRESNEKENFWEKSKISVMHPNLNKISFFHVNSKPFPRRSNKSFSIKNDINKLKLILNDKFLFNFDDDDPDEIKDKFEEKENKEIKKFQIKKDMKIGNFKKLPIKNRTKSMMNMKDLVSYSNGFRRLRKSIPSLINKTKILAKYSSENNDKYKDNIEGLNFFKKQSVIQNLCQSKIKYEKNGTEKKIDEDSYEVGGMDNHDIMGLKLDHKNTTESHISQKFDKDIVYGSYLYKISTNSKKLKKLYYKLYNKDLYYFKSSESQTYKGFHNLSHYYLELNPDYIEELNSSNLSKRKDTDSNTDEDDESYIDSASSITGENKSKSEKEKIEEIKPIIKVIDSVEYFCFILINQKGKAQWYLTPEKEIYNEWSEKLKHVMNYKNIFDKYILKEVAGKGKFSTVYRAIDKINNRTVAIKIIDKRVLKLNELDLIKTEIDILRICQHPYVIGLYEVIETYGRIDIVLEYCKISNLYHYLHNKNFNLTELQIVTYIHKISKAVYSMHNLGIIHRDLKLSNIALASEKEDIRILDFGLSKIIGPGETCSESYGTPGYAAPEVINEENYGFKVDVWSIGAITYFMCTSKLPFDYVTKGLKVKNIVVNTLNDEIKFKEECWKKLSKEVVQFIKGCMNKNPEKRLDIKEVLEHEWIKKFFYKEVTRREVVDMEQYIVDIGKKNHIGKRKFLKSPQKTHSNGIYRLYADISEDEN